MDAQSWLIVAAGVGLGSYFFRCVPLLVGKRIAFPPLLLDWLIYVSLGVTAGIVSKSLFMKDAHLSLDDFPVKIAAIALAVFMQKRYKNMILSLFCGVMLAVALKAAAG